MERKEAIDVIKKNWPDSSFTMLREALETLIPELKESEDERIRKGLIKALSSIGKRNWGGIDVFESISWLEKQGESTDINPSEFDLRLNKLLKQFETLSKEELASSLSFYLNVVQNDGTYREEKQGEQKPTDKVEPKFKVGDKVIGIISGMQYYITKVCDNHYCTESGCIIMFDAQDNFELVEQQLKKIEQKSTDKVEPKFKVGDWVVTSYGKVNQVIAVDEDGDGFTLDDDTYFSGSWKDNYHLWTIQDAKTGDVLCCESGWTCIFKALDNHTNTFSSYCFMDKDKWFCNTGSECHTLDERFVKAYNGEISPATKEQRELLFKSMKDDGYEWDAEKLKLKEIELKPVWNKNDENYMKSAIEMIMHCIWNSYRGLYKEDVVEWLKSFKYRFAENKEEFEE